MKKLLLTVAATIAAAVLSPSAEALTQPGDTALWLRYPAISPDNKTIAFSYQGDIYTMPSDGSGVVSRLTVNPAYDTQPIWSPDGKTIVFASDRNGALNLYAMPAAGGRPVRLTRSAIRQTPMAWLNDSTILFQSADMPDVKDIQFPGSTFPQTYSVTLSGSRPRLFSTLAMDEVSVDPATGRILYQDKKGYEDPLRKHQRSSIARDIWMASAPDASGKRSYTKVTTNPGEDRDPVWAPDGKSFYYLSEQGGSMNVRRHNTVDGSDVALTTLTRHPVRHLSVSGNGTLCFDYNGEIYTLKPGDSPVKVPVSINNDYNRDAMTTFTNPASVRDISVSEKGKEVAFTMRGDVYVTPVDYSTTRRITDTAEQERDVDFAPDGRSMVYAAERGGRWGIYRASLVRDDDKHFAYAHEIKEEPLVVGDFNAFQPKYSPDGSEVAYLQDRTTIKVVNLKSRATRVVLPGEYNYSYTDGDQTYSWSPDGKWFLAEYIAKGGWNNTDIVLVKADGSGEMTNLTQSGYSDGSPKWVLDGKAMIWTSDRAGYRSHGSWGAQKDWYIMFFDGEAYDKFRMSKEEAALADESKSDSKDEKSESKDDDKDKKKGKKDKKEEAKPESKPELKFDLDNRRYRVVRLTPNSSSLSDGLLSPTGDKIYYTTSFEGGADLWMHDFKEGNTQLLIKGLGWGEMIPDAKMENIYINSGGIKKVNLANRQTTNISYDADFTYRPAEEREYIFNHAWRQVKDKFYDPAIHGVDWDGYREDYARFLPHINNNYDFQEMLSELLGELNGSHTGARFRGTNATSSEPVEAVLGAFYDNSYDGDGLRVIEVLPQGPLAKASSRVVPGVIIEQIDGNVIKAGVPYTSMLAGKAGKRVTLKVYNPATGERFEQEVKPVSAAAQSDMLYKRWIASRRALVDSLSGGRIGYIHVKGMDSPSFREVYSDLLGLYRDADAVIIDTRHNGGGWLHDDLATLLSAKQYARFVPRGQFVGNDPFNKWTKPSCVLVCEDNYSNAHGFPWVYKTLGIGKLIGTPVPGTMTAVWWEYQIDPTLVFGIPQVGVSDMQGRYLENLELQPDIVVYNTPEDMVSGHDTQLERAVKEMLQEADAFKAAQPVQPDMPAVTPIYSK